MALKIVEKVARAGSATVLIVEVNQASGFGVWPERCGVVAPLARLLQNWLLASMSVIFW
jgi:hypothetical protein